jgi:HSP20 family protein
MAGGVKELAAELLAPAACDAGVGPKAQDNGARSDAGRAGARRRCVMAIERWRPRGGLVPGSPFRGLARMEREMEDFFGRFFPEGLWPRMREERAWAPAVDMLDRKDEIVLRADLPGMEQKDVEVTVQDGMLTIRGDRKEEKEVKEEDYYYCERWAGAFSRTLSLPAGIDAEKVKATFRNGVLEIHITKAERAKGKTIEIKAA